MKSFNVGAPFERIALDILGPLPRTKQGNKYLLVNEDYFSKWLEAIPIRNKESTTVAKKLVDSVNFWCSFVYSYRLRVQL